MVFTLDPVYLRELFNDSYANGGGCEVFTLVATAHDFYMASSGGYFCDTYSIKGVLTGASWTAMSGSCLLGRSAQCSL